MAPRSSSGLRAAAQPARGIRQAVEQVWGGMRAEDISNEWLEVERQWRPDALAAQFEMTEFALRNQHTSVVRGVPHIFGIFERA